MGGETWRTRWLRATACALGWLAAGCWSGSYTIVVRDDGEGLLENAAAVEVAFVPSCEAQSLGAEPSSAFAEAAFRIGEEEPSLGRLRAGDYVLYVRLRDEGCNVIAAGCEPIRLEPGGQGRLEVTIARLDLGAMGCGALLIGEWHCDRGLCLCEPDCDGRECGPDGCGGDCGPGCEDSVPCDPSDGRCGTP